MRSLVFAAAILIALTGAALAEECGLPPEAPDLPPSASRASDAAAIEVQRSNRDFAQDTEGYLVCLQLAESDIHEATRTGEMRPVEERVAIEVIQNHAGDARGHQSHWRDIYDAWTRAWVRAHHRDLPPLPQD